MLSTDSPVTAPPRSGRMVFTLTDGKTVSASSDAALAVSAFAPTDDNYRAVLLGMLAVYLDAGMYELAGDYAFMAGLSLGLSYTSTTVWQIGGAHAE